jgi:hypothetical protein
MKKTVTIFATALFFITAISTFGREARLVRYPSSLISETFGPLMTTARTCNV